jgi:hypothetical protein
MADYSGLTKKELLYTLLARDLMLEERRKENDLQKATINTLIVDHKASKEWYKKQLEEKEERINWLVQDQLALTEKALELACEELYDSDSISVCSYCPYNLTAECPDICPSDKHILTDYFKNKAKEMKDETIFNRKQRM